MANLKSEFLGIESPNPFWLASAPPTDKAYNVVRALKAGWGGVVWKTLGEDPPIVNVSGPRYGALLGNDRELIGFNNIELITDRPLDINLQEIAEVKRDWPDRAIVVSVMVPCEESAWREMLPKIEATNADGIELNLFPDVVVQAEKSYVELRGDDSYSWFGRVQGDPESSVILSVVYGKLAGERVRE